MPPAPETAPGTAPETAPETVDGTDAHAAASPFPGTALVAGPNGRFGRHAVAAFAAAGWRIRTLSRGEPALPPGAEALEGDAEDSATLSRAAQGADVIVNALNAPYPDWSRRLPRQTAAVLAAAQATGAAILHPGNVYPYGASLPARITPDTPFRPDAAKGRLRAEQEARLKAAAEQGVRTILLRGGDFLDTELGGNWFDGYISAKVDRGIAVYPGPLDRLHSWAFLPDFAAAAAGLAARRAALAPFAAILFPGHTVTGAELVALMSRAAGRPLSPRPFPWWALRLAAPFWPMGREVVEMRYLWSRPHRMEDPRLAALLPDFVATPAEAAVAAALAPRLGRPALAAPRPAPRAA